MSYQEHEIRMNRISTADIAALERVLAFARAHAEDDHAPEDDAPEGPRTEPLAPSDDQDERERQLRREPEPVAEDDPAQPSAGRTFL